MTLRIGTATQTERDPRDLPGTLSEAYWMAHPSVAGRYVLGTGKKAAEQAVYLKASPIASALGRFLMDDASANDERALYLISPTRVVG